MIYAEEILFHKCDDNSGEVLCEDEIVLKLDNEWYIITGKNIVRGIKYCPACTELLK